MAAIKVRGYTYKVGSKTVKVKAHVRRTKGRSGAKRRSTHKTLRQSFKSSAAAVRRKAPKRTLSRYKRGTKGRR
jgi:hypothetical protein